MNTTSTKKWHVALACAALIAVSGCAATDTPEKRAMVEETNDPLEPMNRYLFELNKFMDEVAFKPMAWWYRTALPDPAQDSVANFMANLRMPWTAINDLGQGEMNRAYTAVARFAINTTIGVLGLFDPATGMGFEKHEEDAGQTFGVWLKTPKDTYPEGLYLMIPVFGPSNIRDAVGGLVDGLLDPVNIAARGGIRGESSLPMARSVVSGVDSRSRNLETIDQLQKSSVDFYATVRSVYRQRRDNEIRNGEPGGSYPALNVYQ